MKKLICLAILLFSTPCWAISLGSIPAIKSIQYGNVADAGTATITAVDTNNTILISTGFSTTATVVDNVDSFFELTNATTVSASGSSSAGSVTHGFIALEFYPGAVKQIVNSSISINAPALSNTYTISTPVVTDNTLVFYRGVNGNEGQDNVDDVFCRVTLTNSTTVTANRGADAGNMVVYFSLVELNSWITK